MAKVTLRRWSVCGRVKGQCWLASVSTSTTTSYPLFAILRQTKVFPVLVSLSETCREMMELVLAEDWHVLVLLEPHGLGAASGIFSCHYHTYILVSVKQSTTSILART